MTRTPAVMEIEPCPFCGGKAYAIDQITRQIVECGGCGVEMEGLDLEDAVRQWNHRTPAEPLADGEMIDHDVRRRLLSVATTLETCGKHGLPIDFAMLASDIRAVLSAYNPNDRLSRITTLFDAIQHGDEAHRAWLKEAIDKHFAGEAVPAPKGKGNSDRLREALRKYGDHRAACRLKVRMGEPCDCGWDDARFLALSHKD